MPPLASPGLLRASGAARFFRAGSRSGSLLATVLLAACSTAGTPRDDTSADSGTSIDQSGQGLGNLFDQPITGLSGEFEALFNDGDFAFGTPLRLADGLGPLYTRQACSGCHADGVRGPGLVEKMSVVRDDGHTPADDAVERAELPNGFAVHPLVTGDERTPIVPPGADAGVDVLVTRRLGPPILGRGYVEAVLDSEMVRVQAEQSARTDGIHGRINHVIYESELSADPRFHTHVKGDVVIGRFGLKARIATLDDFTADAFQSDMGITSPLRPAELANPDGLTDECAPGHDCGGKAGVDVELSSVVSRASYVRTTAIPLRTTTAEGAALFDGALCSVCHTPSMRTRADYPIAQLAGIDAPIYTDLLLHHMGSNLADGLPAGTVDGEAGAFDWRTAPLIGLRFEHGFMHDGRAATIEDAIQAHGGEGSEANPSVDRFDAFSVDDQRRLIQFVEAL